jgi:hypothetical protein
MTEPNDLDAIISDMARDGTIRGGSVMGLLREVLELRAEVGYLKASLAAADAENALLHGELGQTPPPRSNGNRPARNAEQGVSSVPPEVFAARLAGFDGTPCPSCGELRVVTSGECWVCDHCRAGSEQGVVLRPEIMDKE